FTNVATQESALLATGSGASVTVSGLAPGTSYHWQARAVDNQGAASSWASFGGNAESAPDFTVGAADTPPASPASLGQFRTDAVTAIAVGGSTPETSVVLKGTVSDPDAGQTVKLGVEVRPLGAAFTNVATQESALLASGSVASVTVSGLAAGT